MAIPLDPENPDLGNVGGVGTPADIAFENAKKIAADAAAKRAEVKVPVIPEKSVVQQKVQQEVQPHPLAKYKNGYEALRALPDEQFKKFVDKNYDIPGIGYTTSKDPETGEQRIERVIENPADKPPEQQMMTIPQMEATTRARSAVVAEARLGVEGRRADAAERLAAAREKHLEEIDRLRIRPTTTVAINPQTNKEEYINTDGSFSGLTPGKKTNVNIARVQKMIDRVTGEGPTPNEVASIDEAANAIGYSYENITETVPGFWGPKQKSSWQLVRQEGRQGGVGQTPTQGESKVPAGGKDSFGFTVGETRKGQDGKNYQYKGNDQWQRQ